MNHDLSSTLLVATTAILVAAVLAPIGGSTSVRGTAVVQCGSVNGASWKIKSVGGHISGSRYTVTASGVSCSLARRSVPGLTRQSSHGTGTAVRGPMGFTCKSWSVAASEDKLVYAGVCSRPPGATSFAWAVKYK